MDKYPLILYLVLYMLLVTLVGAPTTDVSPSWLGLVLFWLICLGSMKIAVWATMAVVRWAERWDAGQS